MKQESHDFSRVECQFSTSMKTCLVSISHKHHLSDNDSIQIRLEDNSSKSVDKARENSLAKLLEIKNLEDNWNGNGASRFSENLIAFVREMIMKLSVQPAIFPTARDSIQLEYENDCGDYLEFEIFEEGRIKMFSFDHAGKSVSKDIGIDEMNQVVSDFYEQQV